MVTLPIAKPKIYKKPENFRVLFVYPNIQMSALAPQGIGVLSAVLKENGFNCELFDSTFYRTPLTTDTNEEKVYNSIVLPYDWNEKGIKPHATDMFQDFQNMVDEYQPDLLAISVVENTWYIAEVMLNSLRDHITTVVGGVFPTYAPEIVLSNQRVDYICRGEGEYSLLELCRTMADGANTNRIAGIWAKKDGRIHRNPIRQVLDINELPFPDFGIFEERSLYRPMQGRVYKTIGLETQRGCPYTCAFCNSPANNVLYKEESAGHFHRKKSVKRVHEELDYMVKNFGPEFIYFVVDTFLAVSDDELKEFADMYVDYKIPFWMNTRAETVDEWRGEQLERMNMLRMNIGVEHGNEKFRRERISRPISNEKMLRAFESVAGRSFTTVANSIIGFPDETRELVFDTIEFNRQLPPEIEASGAFIFTPYHGSELRNVAIEKGFLDPKSICALNVTKGSILEMPHFPIDEIEGLCRVFSFYVKMPKEKWPEIKKAEMAGEKGEKAFLEIREEFLANYRHSIVNPKDSNSFDLVPGEVPDLHS